MKTDPGAPLHVQAGRGRSFGADAAAYERARPGYPEAVATDLGAGPGVRVLDVGCGTGKSSALFLARGCDVVGLEPDEAMAEVARAAGVRVEIADFARFDAAGRVFDLVVAGQAWHWLDPAGGAAKAAAVLEPGGRLAPFWNFRRLEGPGRSVVEECYRRHAPEILDGRIARGMADAGEQAAAAHLAAIAAHGAFAPLRLRRYPFSAALDPDAYRALLATGSDLRLLAPRRREALLAAVQDAVAGLGGVSVHYETLVVDARRR